MANAFNRGDVVQLKSGGPGMTVHKAPGDPADAYPHRPMVGEYHCIWFKGANKEQGIFAEHTLLPFVKPSK